MLTVSQSSQTDRQTDEQTDRQQVKHTLLGGDITFRGG